MFRLLIRTIVWLVRAAFRPRDDLVLENLALRQQLAIFKDKRPRPRLDNPARAFWVGLRTAWPSWMDASILVRPETVARWHRQGFRLYCRRKSRARGVDGDLVPNTLRDWGVSPKRISRRSPWQNGVSERWVLSVRRELLDPVVVLNEAHLRRPLDDYVAYYHEDRCHLSLEKDAPAGREVTPRPSPASTVVALQRVGGLHHRYEWSEDRKAA